MSTFYFLAFSDLVVAQEILCQINYPERDDRIKECQNGHSLPILWASINWPGKRASALLGRTKSRRGSQRKTPSGTGNKKELLSCRGQRVLWGFRNDEGKGGWDAMQVTGERDLGVKRAGASDSVPKGNHWQFLSSLDSSLLDELLTC